MEYLQIVQAVLMSMVAAALYAGTAYASKNRKGESFSFKSMGETVVVAAVVGVIMHFKGIEISSENFEGYMAANAGLVAVLDKGWSFLRNAYRKKFG